jgi:DNA-directed RNA polymerase subunit beta
VAEEAGKVASVNGNQIIITENGQLPEGKKKIKHDPANGISVYPVRKFMRSNAATCINQKILVNKGDHVKKGQVIADGPCTQNGELALGRNVLVAFMPWNGYNFEDAILISEKIVKDDIFTSIHIDEFEVAARDTKLGPEEITRDIPNLGDEALKNLGTDGVIRIGAEVKPGDILVGKITPKSETELAPEERLLRAIFGEKAADVKDTSLKVPSGTYGIVMDVKVSAKKDADRVSRRFPARKNATRSRSRKITRRRPNELQDQLTEALSNILLGEKIPLDVVNSETGEIIIPANRKITKTLLRKLATVYDRIEIDPSPIRNKINEIIGQFRKKFDDLQMQYDEEMERAEAGEGVEAGIVKSVKVYIASKRKLSVGDKMAGRHGNKGVVAKIVKEEDMPYLADGTPVEIVLNPLGVPSRMNVGQVLETHLGWAAKLLGLKFATPVFDGMKEKDIRGYLKQAGLPEHAKTHLLRRTHRRTVRPGNCRRLHLHDEARPLGRGQDSRPRRRSVFARHPAAAGRQGAIRRPALRRNGSVGDGSLRRGLHVAGTPDREIRRRAGPHAHLRKHRQGRQLARGRHPGIVQRARQGNAIARPRCEGRLFQPD